MPPRPISTWRLLRRVCVHWLRRVWGRSAHSATAAGSGGEDAQRAARGRAAALRRACVRARTLTFSSSLRPRLEALLAGAFCFVGIAAGEALRGMQRAEKLSVTAKRGVGQRKEREAKQRAKGGP